ncbi:M14 family zinc carboxypeptidase [Sphingopyxis panaciterrae]
MSVLSSHTSRRVLLASGVAAAGAGLVPRGWTRAPSFGFPDSRGLRAMIAPSLAALGSAARVERLGESEAGQPIDLISIGEGERSALIVGAPHPNEPIGCLTIVALIRRLASDRRFRERSGYRWHFIPAIDVDGLDLNAGWLGGPPTLSSYMESFFRPAFARQPEYVFPIDMPGYRFDTPTPENLCWQRAMEIARPSFQSSLHGNDSGGAFYLLSENRPALASRLSRQPQQAGIALSTLGEPDGGLRNFAPGIFSYFEVKPFLEEALRNGEPLERVWNAGRSSAEFAADRYGTFSVTCEVPLWEDARQFSDRPSKYTMADVQRMNLRQSTENAELLDRAKALLSHEYADGESRALALALQEAAALLESQIQSIEKNLRTSDAGQRVSNSGLVQIEPGTTSMRIPAMISRLARNQGDASVAAQALALLSERISHQNREAPLRVVPVAKSAGLQIKSILTTIGAT